MEASKNSTETVGKTSSGKEESKPSLKEEQKTSSVKEETKSSGKKDEPIRVEASNPNSQPVTPIPSQTDYIDTTQSGLTGKGRGGNAKKKGF